MQNCCLSPLPTMLSVKLKAIKHFKAVLRHPHLPHKAFIGDNVLADSLVLQAEFSI